MSDLFSEAARERQAELAPLAVRMRPTTLEELVATAKENPEVLSLHEPVAFFTGFGASSLDFQIRVW